jgi:hypothetical protein
MPDLDNLDYETTLGVDNGGEPSAVIPVQEPAKPVETSTTTTSEPAHVDDDIERDAQGQPVLDEQGQPKRKMGGFQRRIEKLSRKLQEKDQELEFLRRYALPQAQDGPASQPTAPQAPSQPAAEPVRDQFESNEEYIQALVDHRVKLAITGLAEKQAQDTRVRTEQEVTQQFQQRLQQAPTKYKDWLDVMEDTTAPSTPVMDNIIRRSEFGVDLMYFLAKNEAEAQRIAQLSDPMAQTMAMGALEERFRQVSKTTEKPTPQPSADPAPITPVSTATQAASKPVAEMDGDEYLEHMRTSKKKR